MSSQQALTIVLGSLLVAVLGGSVLRAMGRRRSQAGTVARGSAAALKLPVAVTEFGGFRVVEFLGETQAALLYRGCDAAGRACTIKLPDRSCLADPDELRRFMREEQVLGAIHHPGVLGRIAAGTVEDRGRKVPYLVTEPLPGRQFSDFLAERAPLPVMEAVGLLQQLASILETLHARGIVHRNLGPESICITAEQRVVVHNFGGARGITMETITLHGQLVGTVEYIAPELLFGRPADGRADLYALGVLGYHMVTGHSPFVHTSMAALVKQKNESEGPHPRKDNPEVPLGLDGLVSSLLSREPARRPESAAMLQQALRALEA